MTFPDDIHMDTYAGTISCICGNSTLSSISNGPFVILNTREIKFEPGIKLSGKTIFNRLLINY